MGPGRETWPRRARGWLRRGLDPDAQAAVSARHGYLQGVGFGLCCPGTCAWLRNDVLGIPAVIGTPGGPDETYFIDYDESMGFVMEGLFNLSPWVNYQTFNMSPPLEFVGWEQERRGPCRRATRMGHIGCRVLCGEKGHRYCSRHVAFLVQTSSAMQPLPLASTCTVLGQP